MMDQDAIHPPHAPRVREHIGLVRWERVAGGDWIPFTVVGQFVSCTDSVWRVRLYTGEELEYDLEVWAPYAPHVDPRGARHTSPAPAAKAG